MNRSCCWICVLLLSSILLLCVSCASSPESEREFFLPGEKERILKNLAAEYYTLAEGFAEQKKYAKAAGYYELAKRDDSLYRTAYYKQGRMYALNKEWNKALSVFLDLLEKDPQNTILLSSIAYITAMNGDIQAAIVQYETLVINHPYDSDLLINYIYLLIDAEQLDKAQAQFQLLMNRFPTNGSLETLDKKISEKLAVQEDKTSDSQQISAENESVLDEEIVFDDSVSEVKE